MKNTIMTRSIMRNRRNTRYWGTLYLDPLKKHLEALPKLDPMKYLDFGSVCVVGSSGSLNELEMGNFIDDHDTIVRFNMAPVEGYESAVGSRTTFRVAIGTITEKSKDKRSDKDKPVILRSYRKPNQIDRDAKKNWEYYDPPNNLWVISDWMHEYAMNMKENKSMYPSTGFLGVMMMLQHVDKITMIGFDLPAGDNQGKFKYNYFSRIKYKEDAHFFMEEQEIYNELEAEGRVIRIRYEDFA